MSWTTPELTEIKMDAEVGSYQPDELDGPAFVADEPTATDSAAE